MPTAIEKLLCSNTTFASTNYQSPPTFEELGEMLKTAPPDAARMCIVTCADPRLDPAKVSFHIAPRLERIETRILISASFSASLLIQTSHPSSSATQEALPGKLLSTYLPSTLSYCSQTSSSFDTLTVAPQSSGTTQSSNFFATEWRALAVTM